MASATAAQARGRRIRVVLERPGAAHARVCDLMVVRELSATLPIGRHRRALGRVGVHLLVQRQHMVRPVKFVGLVADGSDRRLNVALRYAPLHDAFHQQPSYGKLRPIPVVARQ